MTMLHKAAAAALEEVGTSIARQHANGTARGSEKKFHNRIVKELRDAGIRVECEVPLERIKARTAIPERDQGYLDILLNGKVGVELKVISTPRLSGKSNSYYDIGQVAGDAARLMNAKCLTNGALVLVVVGPWIQSVPERDLLRVVHNLMYVDYQTARLMHGRSGANNVLAARRVTALKKWLGWHEPYTGHTCKVEVKRVGCIGLLTFWNCDEKRL